MNILAHTSNGTALLQKVRGRSFKELRVRGIQLLHAYAERHGLSTLDRVPTDTQFSSLLNLDLFPSTSPEGLLEDFRNRQSPAFFPAFRDFKETRILLHSRFAATNERAVVDRARRISAGRFDLLGLSDVDFGQPINWHAEPLAATTSPLVHWSRIDYLDSTLAGDKKITWELNRHQYFATLARAYWYTGDEEFARTFSSHIQSWIEQNPPKLGINWSSSLEVGFRSISWLWAIYFFRDSVHFTAPLFQQMLKLLYLHARHLENYLSTYFSPNTHLTGEALALFYLGLLLPQFRESERWRATGESILLSELERHVRPDGVYFEQSSYYHRYTVDFYIHFLVLLSANKQEIPTELKTKLSALLDHLMFITRPDGTTPLFGDDDGGKLMPLDERGPDDFRSTLATGAVLLKRDDYKFVAGEASEETLWLLGPDGLKSFDHLRNTIPQSESRAFEDGGYYVMRDGWSANSNYLLIDCGPLGGLKFGHAHADALSFELVALGRRLLVDPGTYTYTGSVEQRDYFRSSSAHNTLTIDHQSSSVSDGPFSWKEVANARTLKWISRPHFDFFSGEHDGYLRLSSPALHRRSILFIKNDYWIVIDEIETKGFHEYEFHLHFAETACPQIDLTSAKNMLIERPKDESGVQILVGVDNGAWDLKKGWVSRCYRQRSAAAVATFSFEGTGVKKLVTFLIPRLAAQPTLTITSLESNGSCAFELLDEARRDLFMLGRSSIYKAVSKRNEIVADFGVSWLRFDHKDQLQEVVLIDGAEFSIDDIKLVRSPHNIEYLAGNVVGGELSTDVDLAVAQEQQ